MPREDVAAKAKRLLGEGRLTIITCTPQAIVARCKGDSGEEYQVVWDGQNWSCPCAARGRCSHLRALQLVTVKPAQQTIGEGTGA